MVNKVKLFYFVIDEIIKAFRLQENISRKKKNEDVISASTDTRIGAVEMKGSLKVQNVPTSKHKLKYKTKEIPKKKFKRRLTKADMLVPDYMFSKDLDSEDSSRKLLLNVHKFETKLTMLLLSLLRGDNTLIKEVFGLQHRRRFNIIRNTGVESGDDKKVSSAHLVDKFSGPKFDEILYDDTTENADNNVSRSTISNNSEDELLNDKVFFHYR